MRITSLEQLRGLIASGATIYLVNGLGAVSSMRELSLSNTELRWHIWAKHDGSEPDPEYGAWFVMNIGAGEDALSVFAPADYGMTGEYTNQGFTTKESAEQYRDWALTNTAEPFRDWLYDDYYESDYYD